MSNPSKQNVVEMFPSWQGNTSLLKIFPSSPWRKKSHSDQKDVQQGVKVGLHLLHASWNLPVLSSAEDRLQSCLCSTKISVPSGMMEGSRNTSPITCIASAIQVDKSEETMDLFLGDCSCSSAENGNSNDHSNKHSGDPEDPIPCPPENLPALALVLEKGTTTEIQYLSSLDASQILYHVRHADQLPLPTKLVDEIEETIRESVFFGGPGNIKTKLPRNTTTTSKYQDLEHQKHNAQPALRIFVAGDRMSVGKSSVCLGLLGTLLTKFHYSPHDLAYIKPATQNESPQLVQLYCEAKGIECVAVGPIVYYRGFTRAYLAGETESTDELLAKVEVEVDRIAQGKRVVIVDGVGFPAVGSICGTDNATVARASGYPLPTSKGEGGDEDADDDSSQRRRRCPIGVIVVGGAGVGGAVDGFNLNASYFEQAQVPVLGAIFNKLSLEGFYSLENCKTQITSYFDQNPHQQKLGRRPFGFVPLFSGIAGAEEETKEDNMSKMMERATQFFQLFGDHVDVTGILEAARTAQRQQMDLYSLKGSSAITMVSYSNNEGLQQPPTKRLKLSQMAVVAIKPNAATESAASRSQRTRAEIEGRAIRAGAAPSA